MEFILSVFLLTGEMFMKEKIRRWEEEIDKIILKQKEMNAKYNERVRELRKKIEKGKSQLRREENEMIAETYREIYGEFDMNSFEEFKNKMKGIMLCQTEQNA